MLQRLLRWLRGCFGEDHTEGSRRDGKTIMKSWVVGSVGNRDQLQVGYDALLKLYVTSTVVKEKVDFVELAKAMMHWTYVFRDISNMEIALLRSVDDEVLVRTLQKTYYSMIFAFLERWPGLLKGKQIASIRKEFPDLADMDIATSRAFDAFKAKWDTRLNLVRHHAAFHYTDALTMDQVWRSLTVKEFLELVADFRELERPFIAYVGATIFKLQLLLERTVAKHGRL